MPLVDSLLTAIVRSDGDALVLHVGEKPYVVAAAGPVELSRQGLGLGAMEGLLAQLLSADALRTLREMGAVEHELAGDPTADRFTVVAARGGDDIWIEVRRHRRVRAAEPVAEPLVATPTIDAPHEAPVVDQPSALEPAPAVMEVPASEPAAVVEPEPPPAPISAPEPEPVPMMTSEVDSEPPFVMEEPPAPLPPAYEPIDHRQLESVAAAPAPTTHEHEAPPPAVDLPEVSAPIIEPVAPVHAAAPEPVAEIPAAVPEIEPPVAEAVAVPTNLPPVGEPVPMPSFAPMTDSLRDLAALEVAAEEMTAAPPPVVIPSPPPAPVPVVEPRPVAPAAVAPPPPPAPPPPAAPAPPAAAPAPTAALPQVAAAPEMHPIRRAEPVAPRPPVRIEPPVPEPAAFTVTPEPQPTLPGLAAGPYAVEAPSESVRGDAQPDKLPATVLELTRDNARGGNAARGSVRTGGIERLLRLAAARGASALYLTTQARPAVRVDGDIRLLEGEPALSSGDVEAAVLELAPEGARDKESAEWIRDLQDVGRVRITTFRDYRGPGALLRMIQARATSAEQLGLVREIQALATEPEGLVIVTGPRASGKSTLVSAFVDLINRQRNDYVITLEGQIRLVHESRGSLISQRELRGSASEVVAAARAALRENPDVLIIEDLRSPDVLQVALDAAGSGLLVFASVTAASATAALERLVDLCPSEQRRTVRAALAEHLRGVVAQVLLRKAGGGRLAARELVLNTNAVAALVSDGQIAQLPRAIDSGRKIGMAPLNDALVAFVQSGAVDVREAYRKADDKVGLLALLRREGIDTSFVERLA